MDGEKKEILRKREQEARLRMTGNTRRFFHGNSQIHGAYLTSFGKIENPLAGTFQYSAKGLSYLSIYFFPIRLVLIYLKS